MSIWHPNIPAQDLPKMVRFSVFCAFLAGVYGVLHDQISYTISSPYFTQIKFRQFAYVDLGLHPRIFVAEIGFLATWWIGLAGGWLLARMAIANSALTKHHLIKALAIAVGFALTVGALGASIGWMRSFANLGDWKIWQQTLSSNEVRRLMVVAYMHWGSYIGGFLGVLAASLYIRCVKAQCPRATPGNWASNRE